MTTPDDLPPTDDALARRVRAGFDPVLDEPVPDRLLQALKANTVADIATARARRERRGLGWAAWGGMAAAVLVGVAIGRWLLPAAAGEGDLVAANHRWIAGGELAQALDTRSAADLAADAPVRLGTSFIAQDGSACRAFALRREGSAGLACRQGGEWQLQLLARAEATNERGDAVRQAASPWPPALLAAIDERIAGAPMDAPAERQAIARHWAPGEAASAPR